MMRLAYVLSQWSCSRSAPGSCDVARWISEMEVEISRTVSFSPKGRCGFGYRLVFRHRPFLRSISWQNLYL